MSGKKSPDTKVESREPTRRKGKAKQATTTVVSSPEVVPASDIALVEEAVVFINRVLNDSANEISTKIAQYVLKNFFDGNIELARSKNPKKETSFRMLCEHPDLSTSASTISNMIAVEVQKEYLIGAKIELEKLSYTHQRALVRLPDGRDKINLAKEAIEQGLSTRQLEERVKEVRKAIGHPRRLIPDFNAKFHENPVLLFGNKNRIEFALDLDKLRTMPESARQKLKEEIVATQFTLEGFLSNAKSIIKNLVELEQEEE